MMGRTVADLTEAELADYRRALRRRAPTPPEWNARRDRAWVEARRAAQLLRKRFGVTQVAAFGSLVHKGSFTPWSDVDLAVWGLAPEETFRALGAVQDEATGVEINLVDVETCSPELRCVIEAEGVSI